MEKARHLCALAALMTVAYGHGAKAQEIAPHPRLAPTRDVTVLYAVQPQGAPVPKQVTVAFSQDGNKLRIDAGDKIGATILDRSTQQVTLVMNKQRLYMQFSPQQGLRNPFLLDLSMHFTAAGQATIAGLTCGKWTIATPRGSATTCVTDDGVILSEAGVDADGVQGTLTALNVQYGPIAPATFLPPEGYEKITQHASTHQSTRPTTSVAQP